MSTPADQMAQQQGVQPVDYRPGPGGQQVPVYSQGTPGVGGAIMDAIRALAGALAPKSITQAPARLKQQEAEAGTGAPLGSQFSQ